jgi:hypothetical protein
MRSAAATIRRIDPADFSAPPAIAGLRTLALGVAFIGCIALGIGFLIAPDQGGAYAARSLLVACVFWLGISLGALVLFMLNLLTGGSWGLVARRVLEAAARTLPLVYALFMLVLFFGSHTLYEWTHSEVVQADQILQSKAPYLNLPFFFLRQALYFALWAFLTYSLTGMSRRQDREGSPELIARMKRIAAPGIVFWSLAVTFASVDWLMSLQPHWFSTIYGIWLMGSNGLSALAFLIVFAVWLVRREPMSHVFRPSHFHDWGKLLLAFTMLWAYFSYSQFLIIWSGNLPEEITWYKDRITGGWGIVSLIIVVFHFILPFSLLLSRDLKRNANRLVMIAGLMLVMRLVDLFWQVEPAFHEQSPGLYWMYLAAAVAVGGFWFTWFLWELNKRPLLPVNDPYLAEALAHE